MRAFLSIVLVLAFCLSADAQDRPDFQWHTPTAREYLQAILRLPELAVGEREILDLELMTRYADEIDHQDYDLLHAAYDHLYAGVYVPPEVDAFWFQAQVAAWLNSHQIDLRQLTEFQFRDISVPITALDLNGDGADEWLLDLQQNPLQGYVFVQRNAAGQYRTIRTPLPFEPYEELWYAEDITNANWSLEHVGDMNADGQPEIVILYTFQNDTYENTGVAGRYYILTWQDGSFVDLGGEDLSFQLQSLQTTWEWLQSGTRADLHLWQTRVMRDNWECDWEQATIFEWDGRRFTAVQVDEYYPVTAPCILRHAENAMRAGEYAQAISLYEHLEGYDTERYPDSFRVYMAIRRALAYAMSGDLDQGIAIIRAQQNRADTRQSLPELVEALLTAYDENPGPFGLCQAAYNFFWFNPYYLYYNGSMEVGHTVDNRIFGQGMYAPPPASPEGAGCDAPGLLDSLLAQQTFTTAATPVEQLAALGIMASSVYHDDLNGDGMDEWLISAGTALFFVPDGPVYHVSRAAVAAPREPNDLSQLLTIQLPDDAGTALLRIGYGRPYEPPSLNYGSASSPGKCPAWGGVSLWRFADNTLEVMLSALLCETLELAQVVNHLPTVSQIRGWKFSNVVSDYVPVQYVWNPARQTYELTPESQITLTPAASEGSSPPPYQTDNGKRLFLQREYERIVDDFQQAMMDIPDATDPLLLKWRYLAALALEALNRPEEALAEYVAIHDAAPDSAWGMLAALHFEAVGGG